MNKSKGVEGGSQERRLRVSETDSREWALGCRTMPRGIAGAGAGPHGFGGNGAEPAAG